jgi:hypothetical protein
MAILGKKRISLGKDLPPNSEGKLRLPFINSYLFRILMVAERA